MTRQQAADVLDEIQDRLWRDGSSDPGDEVEAVREILHKHDLLENDNELTAKAGTLPPFQEQRPYPHTVTDAEVLGRIVYSASGTGEERFLHNVLDEIEGDMASVGRDKPRRTFRVEARGQETTEQDLGHSEKDARELFHRMSGRGLGIKVVDEKTGDVLLQDPDADTSYASALEAVGRHRRAMGMTPLDPTAAGWTEQDVLDEAERIRRLPNIAGHLMPPD